MRGVAPVSNMDPDDPKSAVSAPHSGGPVSQLVLVLTLLLSLSALFAFTYSLTYESAKEQILDVGGEMFTKVVKDVVGFMTMMDQRVKAGELTLPEAQELVRSYVNGPKMPDGNRDITQSRMSVDDYMYVWASSYRQNRGTLTMHPFSLEGGDQWNYRVKGRYTIRESWSNLAYTGRVFRQLWQNPGEPVYTFIAYQEYFEPWDWIVGCGGREEVIYARRLEGLKRKFLMVGGIFLAIALIHMYSFTWAEKARRQREAEVRELNRDLEKRVRERTCQLEEANRELDSFSYTVCHDLRAPLRAIDGFSTALQEDCGDKLTEEGRKYLDYLREGCSEMGQLIDGLLRLSRSTEGGIAPERLDLSLLAASVAQELVKREPGRRVEFSIQPAASAFADPRLLRSVLENLLGNAWKYTGRQGLGRIEFGSELREGERVYFVRDNGIGFDDSCIQKLFLPFHRLPGAREFPGTGIGLATVARIVKRHHGRVWAHSAPGEGAVFYFTLAWEEQPGMDKENPA